jgi:serine/threonine-protein kinase
MGVVYLAEHRLLKRPCAVKLIRPEQAGDAAVLRRFEREVEATTRLAHPNAVQVYDYGHADDGTFFYVMEYLPGLTLDDLVRRHGPLPPERVVYLLRQLCGALREAHGLGLVHRDVKPGNVMVCWIGGRADVAKLLDFGLVRDPARGDPSTRLTRVGGLLGTPEFMCPEQARAESTTDHRGDLYSLGATAYYALTGRPPFTGPTLIETLYAHLKDPVRPPAELRPDVPADLQAVVLRCLAKDPAGRFADAAGLEKALAACGCADRWGEDQAAAWWLATSGPGDPTAQGTSPDIATFVPADRPVSS